MSYTELIMNCKWTVNSFTENPLTPFLRCSLYFIIQRHCSLLRQNICNIPIFFSHRGRLFSYGDLFRTGGYKLPLTIKPWKSDCFRVWGGGCKTIRKEMNLSTFFWTKRVYVFCTVFCRRLLIKTSPKIRDIII